MVAYDAYLRVTRIREAINGGERQIFHWWRFSQSRVNGLHAPSLHGVVLQTPLERLSRMKVVICWRSIAGAACCTVVGRQNHSTCERHGARCFGAGIDPEPIDERSADTGRSPNTRRIAVFVAPDDDWSDIFSRVLAERSA